MRHFFVLLCVLAAGFLGCKKSSPPVVKSSESALLTLTFTSPLVSAVIDQSAKTITIVFPMGTDRTKLVPTMTFSPAAVCNPNSGVAVDFSVKQQFTVTAEDGVSKTVYTYTPKSIASSLLTLTFTSPAVNAVIDQTAKTIKATFPVGTDPTKLAAAVTFSDKATCSPASGTTLDYSATQQFTVTAEDGMSKSVYTYTPTLPTASAKDVPTAPLSLGIYYAWPSYVNGSNGDINNAITTFKDYDILVFGDGIWKITHGDYAKTKQIIAALRAAKPAIKIYGYIDLGVSTQNLSVTALTQAIDGWQSMGVTGVFGDDFGYDFRNDRARQNQFIDYAHSKSLSVFANAWAVADALGGSDCHLGKGDYYLLESFLVGQGSYRSLDEFKSRGDLAYYYMKTLNVSIATVATITSPNASSSSSNQFLMSWYGTAMYNFDAFQFTDTYHSSTSSQIYHYNNPLTSYGIKWKQYDWVEKMSSTGYRRSTDTYTFTIMGDGATTGTGSNTKP